MNVDQLFSVLNQRLEHAEKQWKTGKGLETLRRETEELRAISEEIIEKWLSFEERLRWLQKQIQPDSTEAMLQTEQFQSSATALTVDDIEVEHRYYASEEWRKGKAYYDLMMFEQALPYLEKTLHQFPDYEYARLLLGHAYLACGHVAKAKYHLQFLAETSANRDWESLSLHALACIEGANKAFDQALHFFRKINFEDLPQNWKRVFVMNYIQTLDALRMDEECMEELQAYYRSFPFDWQAPYMIGCILMRNDDTELALTYWFQALQLEEHPDLLKAMAKHFEQSGCYQIAAQCYERMLQNRAAQRDPGRLVRTGLELRTGPTARKMSQRFFKSAHSFPATRWSTDCVFMDAALLARMEPGEKKCTNFEQKCSRPSVG